MQYAKYVWSYLNKNHPRNRKISSLNRRHSSSFTHSNMDISLSARPNHLMIGVGPTHSTHYRPYPVVKMLTSNRSVLLTRRMLAPPLRAGDDSEPFEMSVENALKVLGVSDGASFEEILRAKNSVIASCKNDQQAITQVEAAYDMLLMQRLSQRRAGKVVDSAIRYADVKPVNAPGTGLTPKWLQTSLKNPLVSVEAPSTRELGVQAGVYGALMVFTYVNGVSSSSSVPYSSADVPGLILATSFGASLYFMTKKNVKLGKATGITIGGLVAGALVGSAVESWLHVDVVPFMGIHTPATIVSEFVLFSQFLISLYLR